MKLAYMIAAVGLWGAVQGRELPISAPLSSPIAFETQDAAATMAERLAATLGRNTEFGGAVYRVQDLYYYTQPVTERSSFEVDFKIHVPMGAVVVALYHTHPDSTPYASSLSESDRSLSQRIRLPMYVGVLPTGQILKYEPSTHQTAQLSAGLGG